MRSIAVVNQRDERCLLHRTATRYTLRMVDPTLRDILEAIVRLDRAQRAQTEFRAEVATMRDSMSTMQGSMSTMQGSMSTMQGSMSTVQDSMSTMQDSMSTMQDSMSTMRDSMATKAELGDVRNQLSRLDGKVDAYRAETKSDLIQLEAKLDMHRTETAKGFADLDHELTKHAEVHRSIEKDIETLKRRPARTAARPARRRSP